MKRDKLIKNFHVGVAALIIKGNKLLLHHRTDRDQWDLPSGGVENNETFFEALKREVKEETGLNIKPLRLVGVYQNYEKRIIILLFVVKVLSGKLTKNKEADDFKYFDYRNLPKKLYPLKRERILNYFSNKNKVTVKVQKNVRYQFRK